jgi:monooxygenase
LVEEGAARVTVLQRSPTYIMPVPRENVAGVPHPDRIARLVRALFGLGAVSHFLLRVWKVFNDTMTTLLCDSFPKEMKRHALEMVERFGGRLAGERLRMDPHFTPRYNLWEERACLAPDGDFFAALGGGRLEVVTDLIERVTEDGILLQGSGEVLPADVIVTATGIHVLPPGLGDMELSIDGEPYTLAGKLAYKGALPARCPNLVLFGGYTRASWTLRVELVSHYLVRILKHMESRGYTRFAAHPDSATEAASLHESPAVSLKSGYIRRAAARLPVQSGTRGPWRSTDLYIVDAWRMRLTPLEDRWLRFS